MRLLPSTIQKRFLIGLLFIVLLTALFFFIMLRSHMRDLYLSEAHSKADLMVAHTEAIQHYVRSILRPIVSNIVGVDEFIIEAMSSSYVTRNILDELSIEEKDFTYRRVARNARNMESEVNEKEAVFFDKFLAEPESNRMEENFVINGKEYLVVARPVYFSGSCMRCHGDPKDAPDVLISMYGDERGFSRQSGELAGLDIVTVPVEGATSAISKSVTMFAICFSAGMLLLLLSVQSVFHRLVVINLRRVANILQQSFFRQEGNKTLVSLLQEMDIEIMIDSIKSVATELSTARSQLNDYTKNLEGKVKERTIELETLVHERSADVQLFMRLLTGLNNIQDKQSLLHTSLRLIATHFSANKAIYMCGLASSSYIQWPPAAEAFNLYEDEIYKLLVEQLKYGEGKQENNLWLIPVQTTGETRGMLALYWEKPEQIPAPDDNYFRLALALGHQLGIALDNLDALDVLLRQHSLLDSIVEGVKEPLILLEEDMKPALSNSSARELALRLLKPENSSTLRAEKPVKPTHTEQAASTAQEANIYVASLLELLGLEVDFSITRPVTREIVLDDGNSFAVSLHPLPHKVSDNARAVVHLRETTEEKQILAHMRQSDKLAAVGQLAAGLAHEINNPLGVIQCYAELMKNSEIDAQSQADLNIILSHVDQARSVLRDLLDFSCQRTECPGSCDLNELMRSLFELFNAQGRAAHIEIRTELTQTLPKIHINSRMLEQVIVNLLLNARDAVSATRPAGQGIITLRAKHLKKSDQVRIEVIDNGGGIAEELLPKIFDPFFTTKGPGEGTGLGLSIAFGMISDMQGRLEVHNCKVEGYAGTAFSILLPITQPEHCVPEHGA